MNRFTRNALAFVSGILFIGIIAVSMGATGGFPSRPTFQEATIRNTTNARLNYKNLGQAADEKTWYCAVVGVQYACGTLADSGAFGENFFEIERTGTALNALRLMAGADGASISSAGGISLIATGAGNISMFEGGVDRDIASIETGSYTGTVTGCTTSPTVSIPYTLIGNRLADGPGGIIQLQIPTVTCTSNTTGFSITGAPAELRPATSPAGRYVVHRFTNNSVAESTGAVNVYMSASGVLEFERNGVGSGFTNTGTKGITQSSIGYNYMLDVTP